MQAAHTFYGKVLFAANRFDSLDTKDTESALVPVVMYIRFEMPDEAQPILFEEVSRDVLLPAFHEEFHRMFERKAEFERLDREEQERQAKANAKKRPRAKRK
jgi:hypothetical protein